MTNLEIADKLRLIANRLDETRIVTKYSSNEGRVAAEYALTWIDSFTNVTDDKEFASAIADCKTELLKAIEKDDKYLRRRKDEFGNPSDCPIAALHAIERLLYKIVDKIF